jgi:hypothetical protein
MRIPIHFFSLALFPSRLLSLSRYCVQKSPTLKQHASQIIVHCCINNCMGIQGMYFECDKSCNLFKTRVQYFKCKKQLVKHLQKFHQTALLLDSPSIHDDAQCTEQPDDDVHFSGGDTEEEPRTLGPSTCADMPHFEELIVDPHTDLDHIRNKSGKRICHKLVYCKHCIIQCLLTSRITFKNLHEPFAST